MKNNISKFLWSVAAILIVLTGFVAYSEHHKQTHFICQNEITFFNQHAKMVSDNGFQFDGTQGRYTATGSFSINGQPAQQVNNTFGFNFWLLDKKIIIMANEESHHSPSYKKIPLYIPDVVFHRDMAIVMNIIKINRSAYLLLRNDVPIFYCKKTS
ncbi:hypothetical protein [Atlantibacter sp.]|uniref:hypothetical protein n=1 Tax=Atlantibacter sp. TaxID=1903473 RepID=UPI0028AD27A1|nr:hypothetical protein [Atlantibacter sp.]